jgi:hypothetical protein
MMDDIRDPDGRTIQPGARVALAKDIEMERLFSGYDAALAGAALPRDLAVGCEGQVVEIEYGGDPRLWVEFTHNGTPFWRGTLRPDEVRRLGLV